MRFNFLAVLGIALLLTAAPAARAGTEEREVAARLAGEARDLLDRLLGPGKARVIVTVEGQSLEVDTQSEILTPVHQGAEMPGYVEKEPGVPADFYQKDLERSTRKDSYRIAKLLVVVVLDKTLDDAQESLVRRILPAFLRMRSDRGDEMTVLRAALLPPWKSVWMTPEGMRILPLLAGAVLIVLFVCVTGYLTATHSVRSFLRAVLARRTQAGEPPYPAQGPIPAPALGPDADLGLSAGMPSLTDEEDAPLPAGERLALGRRFDFLGTQEPREIAAILLKETPGELALLFAHLSRTDPDLATVLFSHLPQTTQTAVSRALVTLQMSDPEKLAMLETRLRTAADFAVRGHERLGVILSRMAPNQRGSIIDDLNASDPDAAREVEQAVFSFEDIIEFKPEELRRLLVAVPHETWGIALRGAPGELLDRVLGELPAGIRPLVRDAADIPQPEGKVLEARSRILTETLALAEKGLIKLGSSSSKMI